MRLMTTICRYCPQPTKESSRAPYVTCGSPVCVRQQRKDVWTRQHAKKREQTGAVDLECPICKLTMNEIGGNHLASHGLTRDQFMELYPGMILTSGRTCLGRGKSAVQRSAYASLEGVVFDEDFHAFMTGTLLGDGSLERQKGRNGNLKTARYAEGGSNEPYLTWKRDFLAKYVECSFNKRTSKPHVKSGKRYTAWWLRTKAYPVLTDIHSLWYPDGKKVVPFDYVMRFLNPLALSVWACDDGHRDESGLMLYTMAFSLAENKMLAGLIAGRFNVTINIREDWKGKPYLYIRSGAKGCGIRRIDEMLNSFSIPGMGYKSVSKSKRRLEAA